MVSVLSPPSPPTAFKRVNPDGTASQAQLDYERSVAQWVSARLAELGGGAIPFPTPTTLGGVKSATAPTHQFQRGIDGTGSPLFAQPSASDISGLGSFATASTISAGSVTGLGALATLSSVDLASQVTGNLAVSHLNSGIDASSSKFWRGDGTWATPAAAPGGTSPQIQFNNAGLLAGFTVTGDGTLDPTSGALVITKTNGVAFASVATSGSASDLGTGTLPNARLSAVPNSALANSTISGISLGSNLGALTIGTHLTGTSYNGSAGVTIATDAASANTVSTIVARDGSGNFSAGTITAALTGHASADLQASNNLSDLASAKTARSSTGLNVESGTGHGNSDYTILSTDRWVYTNAAFTAPRTWTLPAASSVNAGGSIIIDDLQNTLTATNTLTIARAGSDLINALNTLTLGVAGLRCVLISDGTSKWTATLSVTGATGTGSAVLSNSPTITGLALISSATIATLGATSLTVSGTANITTLNATTINATSTAVATGTITINADAGGNANMEIGSTSVSTTPYIDFHSSGNNIDYDARIIASGGTGSAGNGSLTAFAAGGFNLNSGGLLLNASATSKNAVDASGQTGFTIANGASQALPITSGAALALVIDASTGHTAVYLLAGSPGILVSSDSNWVTGTTPGAGNNSVAWNGSAYAVFNNCGTGTHTYKALLLRIA